MFNWSCFHLPRLCWISYHQAKSEKVLVFFFNLLCFFVVQCMKDGGTFLANGGSFVTKKKIIKKSQDWGLKSKWVVHGFIFRELTLVTCLVNYFANLLL